MVAPQELWDGVRARGVVPFAVKFLVYTKKKRHVYEVNLLRNTLLKDFRAGLFPVAGWAPRDVEIYPEFDKFHASLDIPEIPRKVMELAFETGRLTPAEVMNVFGMTLPVAVSNMDVLANRGILQLAEGSAPKRPDSGYMFNMKWFHSGGKVEAKEMQAAPATAASIAKAAMQEGKEEKIAMRPDTGPARRGGAAGEDGRKVCPTCGAVMGFAAPVCPSCGRPA